MHDPDTISRPRRSARRRLLTAVVPLALAVAALPAAAVAATVELTADGTLNYRGAPGETNSISVFPDGTGVGIADFAARLTPRGSQCRSINPSRVQCAGSPTNIRRMDARLGDRDDSASIGVSFPLLIDAGAGSDTFKAAGIANEGSRISRVEFRGGDGFDEATYAGADRGVRVTNDGVPGDGRVGFDEQNVGRDVEKLTGSRFGDDITAIGDAAVSFPLQSVAGGQGDDTVRDGPGSVVTFFEMGSVDDGADKIIGGGGESRLDYTGRTRPVNVTLNFGGADDGEAGEGDEIIGGNEGVGGGQAGDTLRAPAGSTAAHQFDGGGGDDTIEGADGPDTLIAGGGQDTINALGGADLIRANDGVSDVVGCGPGTDTAELDSRDGFNSCENRPVGVLRLAPKALRAQAGDVARLTLGWRHPRGWRRLRRIELRLTQRGVPVGEVTIRPRARRLAAAGAARLVTRATELTRRDDTVTARLALRLDRGLAGRRLAIEVEAVDTRGHRQLEPTAGSIRVAD